tara:strand:- start:7 stop:546 length:540 start_codon:yes stop_codon:yes gene_type:complete
MWYYMTNNNRPAVLNSRPVTLGEYTVIANNESINNVLPVFANKIFDALHDTLSLPCAASVRSASKDSATNADDIVEKELCQVLAQIGLNGSLDMANLLINAYAYARWRNDELRENVLNFIYVFDESSLEKAVQAMNPDQKCIMFVAIIKVNELFKCGLVFGRIDTLQSVLNLVLHKYGN